MSETAIRTILDVSKYLTNKDDEAFYSEMKHHIKYFRKQVNDYKPYLNMFKNIQNLLK